MKFSIVSIMVAAVGLSACTTTVPTRQAPLGADAVYGGGTYTSPGGLTVAADVRNFGGKTGVCGIWAESDSQSVMTRGRAVQVLESGVITFRGAPVLRGLRPFNKVEPAADYTGVPANCVVTDRAWRADDSAYAPAIITPRQVVYRDLDERGGGITIHYRPGTQSAHVSDPKPWD